MAEQTDSKVPQIRFKGVEGEWEELALGDLFPITSAARVHKNEWTKSGVPFFRSSDVVSHFKDNENTKAYISHELYQKLSAKVGRIKKGDILVTGGGSIGIPYLVKTDEPLYFKDADLLWFKIREAVDSHYLYTFFCSEPFRRYLKSTSHIGTIAHYTVEQAKSTPLRLPKTPPEQTQIGVYFRELDSLIGLHQHKHDKLVTLKKTMLQKMFPQSGDSTPEIRFKGFSGDWVESKLGELSSLITKGTTPLGSCGRGWINFVKIENINKFSGVIKITSKISEVEHLGYLKRSQLKSGDILFSIAGTLGRVAVVPGEILPANTNQALAIIRLSGGDVGFIATYLKTRAVDNFVKQNPTVGAQPNLSLEQVRNLEVLRPPEREQQKIGTYFRTLDGLITKHATQLQKLQQIKFACLVKMFA